jgi:hypothetical protein
VDGQPAALPLRLSRDGREHLLVFSAPGFRDESRSVEAIRDVDIALALETLPEPAKAAPPRERRRHFGGNRSPADAAAQPAAPRPPSPATHRRPSAITDL